PASASRLDQRPQYGEALRSSRPGGTGAGGKCAVTTSPSRGVTRSAIDSRPWASNTRSTVRAAGSRTASGVRPSSRPCRVTRAPEGVERSSTGTLAGRAGRAEVVVAPDGAWAALVPFTAPGGSAGAAGTGGAETAGSGTGWTAAAFSAADGGGVGWLRRRSGATEAPTTPSVASASTPRVHRRGGWEVGAGSACP